MLITKQPSAFTPAAASAAAADRTTITTTVSESFVNGTSAHRGPFQ